MSFRPRYLMAAIVAGLAAFGFGVSKDMAYATKRTIPQSQSRARLTLDAPLSIRRKHAASRPAKKCSRTKSRKRRRSVVRMRGHK